MIKDSSGVQARPFTEYQLVEKNSVSVQINLKLPCLERSFKT